MLALRLYFLTDGVLIGNVKIVCFSKLLLILNHLGFGFSSSLGTREKFIVFIYFFKFTYMKILHLNAKMFTDSISVVV